MVHGWENRVAPLTQEAGGSVLVVDEEVQTIRRLSSVLKTTPYVLARCVAIDDVRRHADDRGVCAIVSDASLRKGTAVQLLEALHKHNPDIPIIILASGADAANIPEWVRLGAFQQLTPPILPERFLAAVAQAARSYRIQRFQRQSLELLGNESEQIEWKLLRTRFERALASVWLAYQPIVRARNGTLYGFEGLLRCDDPELTTPGRLIDMAVRLGSLSRLGQAIRSHAASSLVGEPSSVLFLNVHPLDLVDPDLHDYRTKFTSLAPRIVLEFSARTALQDVGCASSMLRSLRDRGFRTASDNFGTGHFGPSNFTLMQPDFVKIDRELIRGLHGSQAKQELVASIAAHFRGMGVSVIALGIENSWERRVATELGCDLLQGNFFSPPVRSLPVPCDSACID
jgi:EAL domain-containing protein (putative c-di-GMP-specific phosphodiesterase class I)